MKLILIGDGDKRGEYEKLAAGLGIEFAGQQDGGAVRQAMGESKAVVAPSECWETFGLSAAEAMQAGTPVVVSDCGALPDLVNGRVEHKDHKESFLSGEESPDPSCAAGIKKSLCSLRSTRLNSSPDLPISTAKNSTCSTRSPRLKLEIVSEGKSAAEMVELMRSADALVMPSYGDTGPTVVKEAISQGLWPIVYSGSGAEELVKRYRFGSVVKCGDVDALAREMISRVERVERVENSRVEHKERKEIGRDLSRENVWGRLLEVYREQMSGVEVVVQPGSSAAILQRCRHLRRVFSRGERGERVEENSRVEHKDHKESLRSLRLSTANNTICSTRSPRPIIISSYTGVRQNLAVAIKAKLRGQKVIREINEWPFSVTWNESKLKQWFEIHVLPKFFDGFICMTDLLVDFCREHGRKNVPIFKWPMSVDVEEVNSRVERVERVGDYVAYAGGMSEAKDGVETLKKACEGYELKMLNGLERKELMWELSGAAALLVVRPDTLQNRAGFPTKLGEFLALGRPVIVTNVGEIGRFLKDGVNAFVIDIGENNSRVEHKEHKEYMERMIREKLREVFADREKAERIGKAGREAALKYFDYKVYAEDLREFIKKVGGV